MTCRAQALNMAVVAATSSSVALRMLYPAGSATSIPSSENAVRNMIGLPGGLSLYSIHDDLRLL